MTRQPRPHLQLSPAIDPLTHSLVALLLVARFSFFSLIGKNFCSADNFLEIVRLSVEIGLLALALTPVIVTGGIDLSVGSLMGLSAVVFGKMWRDARLTALDAPARSRMLGGLAGCLNALLITSRGSRR